MIVKLLEPFEWQRFASKKYEIKAVRMKEDFYFETARGWNQGHKGQWLIECGEALRFAIDDESFKRQYVPAKD